MNWGLWLFRFGMIWFVIVALCSPSKSAEISLFNSAGNAVAYIDTGDGLTIYTWEGRPVAYLYPSENMSIYGFNGDHIGWLRDGLLVDHDGNPMCALKNALLATNLEGLKSLKMMKPMKSMRELAPMLPMISHTWSSIPCSIGLAKGAD